MDDVTLTLRAGTVTALAGENGAGKSTLIKVLSGSVRADSGEVRVGGQPLPSRPGDVIRAGVSTIYQELTDVPEMSVLDNVLLARHERRFGFLREAPRGGGAGARRLAGLRSSPALKLALSCAAAAPRDRALPSPRRAGADLR
jgi:ABC-type sugar transport system ATPase subunit